MFMFNKKLTGILTGALLAGLLTACSDSDDDDRPPADDNSTPESGDSSSVLLSASDTELQATIRRTTNGVPHINSSSLEGVAFGAGYAQAQDNVCLLAEQFVKARSERAKYFGPGENNSHIISDFSYQALRILSGAEDEYAELTAESTALLDGFTAGYNKFISDTVPDELPVQCNAAAWVKTIRPQDLMAYYRIVGQYASGNLFADGAVFSAVPPGESPDPVISMESESVGSIDNAISDPFKNVAWDARNMAGASLARNPDELGSNAWGIGSGLSENGKGALLANPHFLYTGARRFYQMHMTVPGYLDVHGAGLTGTALPLISFNENLGWSHTVSESRRFTFYELTLKEGDDLVYIKDGVEVPIVSETFRIEVDNGTPTPTILERDFYFSEYGPMLPADLITGDALPSWGEEGTAYTFRDANETMGSFLDTWLQMSRATNLAEFQQVFRDCGSTRWTNTIYADDQGNAYYIDSSSVPDLTDEALAVIADKRAASPQFNAFFENELTLLDGSTSRDDWADSGCGGLVPYDRKPSLVRTDFVQNSNDSHWATNPAEFLTGFSPLFGSEATDLTARTRLGLTMVQNPSEPGFADTPPAGADDKFGAEDLINTLYNNRSFYAETLLPELRERCTLIGAAAVNTSEQSSRAVDQACAVLAGWDGVYNLDSVGAHVFRIFIDHYVDELEFEYTVPFDAADPVATPSTPNTINRGGSDDAMLLALARAADVIEAVSLPYTATLGSVQSVYKSGGVPPGGIPELLGEEIPWHGATSFPDGGFNAVGAVGRSVAEDTVFPRIGQENVAFTGGLSSSPEVFWRIDRGISWHFGLEFDDAGPVAYGLLSYSQSTDPASAWFNDQSQRYSQKDYRQLVFTEADIAANLIEDGSQELTGSRVTK